MAINSISISSPVGYIILFEEDGYIIEANMRDKKEETLGVLSPVLSQAIKELEEYFAGDRKEFTVPLKPKGGTEFQQKVWQGLCNIPYGETLSYAGLAKSIGLPKAQRAVGNANGKNPISIFIP